MGGVYSILERCKTDGNTRRQAIEIQQLDKKLLMPSLWTDSDALYDQVTSVKEKFQDMETGMILWKVTKFIPCQVKFCICKGGSYQGAMLDSYGWKDSTCSRFGCKHLKSDHMLNLTTASTMEFTSLTSIVFDIMNIKVTLEQVSFKEKCGRHVVLENILLLINRELTRCIRSQSYMSFNILTFYEAPPFEHTNIEQILYNFCMYAHENNTLELKHSLIMTKFVLRYFESWTWNTKEVSVLNSNKFAKSYDYYYERYLMYCYLPRCVHSISQRFRATKIFGQDVLRYTLQSFRSKLQIWCYKESVAWSSLTKLYCLVYLPAYFKLLEEQVYANKSPIWFFDYNNSDFKNEIKIDL